MNYSEDQLVNLAKNNPEELLRLLSNPTTKTVIVTFATEIMAAEIADEEVVLPVLKRLLRHINALVREGALIGVQTFYSNKIPPLEILNKLSDISNLDPSKEIKSLAKDLLEKFSK